MREILRDGLVGKRLRRVNGTVTDVIEDVKFMKMSEPDSPSNDWWGHEWDELCVIYDDTSYEPVKNIINLDVI